ncbi:MAG: hypothetical protein RL131_1087 [Bacteroidota bacterium]|jgi:TrmH family RNA methyltransferase
MISKSDVKYIQSLAHKKFRDEAGEFVVEGVKMVDEWISEKPEAIRKIYALKSWIGERKSVISQIPSITEMEEFELEKISGLATPNQVVAIVQKPQSIYSDIDKSKTILALDDIQDPGNLGTIIRTCDWFGIQDIICSNHTVDVFNPKVVQSSMGSVLRVHVHYKDLPTFLKEQKGIEVYAAALNGISITKIELKQPCILVIGNESKGIGEDLTPFITQAIAIPKTGRAESLNAAVAASILISRLML